MLQWQKFATCKANNSPGFTRYGTEVHLHYRHTIPSGFITIHGNQSEQLSEAVIRWLAQNPLNPLEQEVVLVQSNAIAEWCKMEFARLGGVCAATRVELPSRFLWRTYRQVLSEQNIPHDSPLDKIPMTWRLMAILPALLERPSFAQVKGYLRAEEPERLLHLASRLADLFDQYQNYRTDWLRDWAAGDDVLRQANGEVPQLSDDQRWQAELWREVLATLQPAERGAVRADIHQQVIDALQQHPPGHFHGKVARRVVVFGVSHLPAATLQALAALSAHCQVILAVPNPCRYFWGDIMDGREWFRTARKRQAEKQGRSLAHIPLEDLHVYSHPLLAAWGRQCRDFVRLLDEYDNLEQTHAQFPALRVDLFEDSEDTDQTPMLLRVQHQIRDLEPLPTHTQPLEPSSTDRSIVFHVAHSRVRELEILHDQLLDLLMQQPSPSERRLQPRDIVVMVPNIEVMAASIRAVFGQFKRDDPRFIPFGIADMSSRAMHPALTALDWVLHLPRQRSGMSELVDLLEVPAIAKRFGISAEDLPALTHWMAGAGICWGLNRQHREGLQLGSCGEQNSAWFGLQRMLLGYASGQAAQLGATAAFAGIEPYAEIGGLAAEWVGGLAHMLHVLNDWHSVCQSPATPVVWVQRYRQLLTALFDFSHEDDQDIAQLLEKGLQLWLGACEQAGFEDELPWFTAQQAWQEAWHMPSLEQKFRAGGVTFCTLMPMRAIPFEVVCLLGMNEGEYPRRTLHADFDLMRQRQQYRPGDRSRQFDDRQLMLEALLSARRVLYVSWTGRSVRDNKEQPPSVLVAQLRDYLAHWWGPVAVTVRTTEHPLQPFSRRYFEAAGAGQTVLHTYAAEWRALHQAVEVTGAASLVTALPAFVPDAKVPLTLQRLGQFLRNPVRQFFKERLGIYFPGEVAFDHDLEPFVIKGLEHHQLIQEQLTLLHADVDVVTLSAQIDAAVARLLQAGQLPMLAFGERQKTALGLLLKGMADAWLKAKNQFPVPAPRHPLRFVAPDSTPVVLEDWLDELQTDGKQTAWLQLLPSKVWGKEKTLRLDKLLPIWLRLLAASVAGHAHVSAVVIAADARLDMHAPPPDEAAQHLRTLLSVWQQGMAQPLPLPLHTALAVAALKPEVVNDRQQPLPDSVRNKYEGADFSDNAVPPEVAEPCLARQFPDLAALDASGTLRDAALAVYSPLREWSRRVTVTPHSRQTA